jgi:hypothetical protein
MRFKLWPILVGTLCLQGAVTRPAAAQRSEARVRVAVTVVAAPIAPATSDSLVREAAADLTPRLLSGGVRLTVSEFAGSAVLNGRMIGRPVTVGASGVTVVRRVAIEYVGS